MAANPSVVTRTTALQLAQAELDTWHYSVEGDSLILLADKTEETPYAWVIYYTSKRWYETNDFRYAIAGACPFIIAKQTGRITQYSSAYGTEEALEKYEGEEQLYGLLVTADLSSMRTKLLLKKLLPLANQELLQLTREPNWVARGGQQRLKALQISLQQQGLSAEVQPCFPCI